MTTEELDYLIPAFRKETEDLIKANIKDTFQTKYGEVNVQADTPLVVQMTEAYAGADLYEVILYEATDTDGANMTDAITISERQADRFTLTSLRDGRVRWETTLKMPKINFWTDGTEAQTDHMTLIKRADGGFTFILNDNAPRYFSNFTYETNAEGAKLSTPSGTGITPKYFPPSVWTVDGHTGFTNNEQLSDALDSLLLIVKSGATPQNIRTYIIPPEQVDGARDTFFMPENFILQSIMGFTDYVPVYSTKQFAENEITPNTGICNSITFTTAPEQGTLIVFTYQKSIIS